MTGVSLRDRRVQNVCRLFVNVEGDSQNIIPVIFFNATPTLEIYSLYLLFLLFISTTNFDLPDFWLPDNRVPKVHHLLGNVEGGGLNIIPEKQFLPLLNLRA